MSTSAKKETRTFGGAAVEVLYVPTKPAEEFPKLFPPVRPTVSLDNGIVIERDVALKMRDGTKIYTDIYRPEGAINVPAIVAWSPYGKTAGWAGRDEIRAGTGTGASGAMQRLLPENIVSPYAKFEGPDPAYWCHYGYAVINPDPRGVGNSEGDISWFGTREAEDCFDLIEWIAGLDWSNGKVAMQGNSWLAVMSWFTAALRPPHLTCIAPWSGLIDIYFIAGDRGFKRAGRLNPDRKAASGCAGVADRWACPLYAPMNGCF